MNSLLDLQRCQTFINCQLHPAGRMHFPDDSMRMRAVTISRQSGSGGHAVAEKLVSYLRTHSEKEGCPWTVFDRDLVQKALEEHHLPERMARFMPEDRISEMVDTMDELFGLHPPSWTLVRKISETIHHLAELGNVIIIGRAASIITARLKYVFHVRLVGSLAKRIAHMQELKGLSAKEAREFVLREDLGRDRYLKKYFGKDIDDPLLYHLTLNTDLISYDEAARLIGEAMLAGKHELSDYLTA